MTTLINPIQDLISVAVFVLALIFLVNFVADQFGGLTESWLRGLSGWRKRQDDL